MRLLVCIDLHPLWRQTNLIMYNDVVGRGDSALADMLAHNEEVIPATRVLPVSAFHYTKPLHKVHSKSKSLQH